MPPVTEANEQTKELNVQAVISSDSPQSEKAMGKYP